MLPRVLTRCLKLVKLMIKQVLSKQSAKAACLDAKSFYLNTPMDEPEHVRILNSFVVNRSGAFLKKRVSVGNVCAAKCAQ